MRVLKTGFGYEWETWDDVGKAKPYDPTDTLTFDTICCIDVLTCGKKHGRQGIEPAHTMHNAAAKHSHVRA